MIFVDKDIVIQFHTGPYIQQKMDQVKRLFFEYDIKESCSWVNNSNHTWRWNITIDYNDYKDIRKLLESIGFTASEAPVDCVEELLSKTQSIFTFRP